MLFSPRSVAVLFVLASSCLTFAVEDGPPKPYAPTFYKGFDLSSLKIEEDGGAIYKDAQDGNVTKPVEDILVGMNTVRLRLWVHPVVPFDGGYYETYNLQKNADIPIDFSDYWADPNHNIKPKEWPNKVGPLADTLRHYVSRTLKHFSAEGIDLSLVSLGNEIRNGMLWPVGEVSVDIEPKSARIANFTNLATLYSAARQGVRDAVAAGVSSPQVMIHIDNGWNLTLQETWFSSLTGTGKVTTEDWDIFGFSFYPFYGTSATLSNLKTSLNTIAAKYGKPIHVVETDWPNKCSGPDAPTLSNTKIPISAKGQTEWVHDIARVVKQIPHGLGRGINYWEPAWLNNTGLGSACQSAILFNPDWSQYPKVTGYSLPSVTMMEGV